MNLKNCQQHICAAVDPTTSEYNIELAKKIIIGTDDFTTSDRLLVYRHSITGTQQRVLHMVYPVCLQILGETCFDNLARDYVWSVDSNSADLNQYGENFPYWLRKQLNKHSALRDYEYLADLACFEWYWHQCLFAKGDPQFDFHGLPGLIEEYGQHIIPQLSHSLSLFSSPWPVYEIWHSHKYGTARSIYSTSDSKNYYLICYRGKTSVKHLSGIAFHFLRLCQQHKSLAQIADALGDRAGEGFALLSGFIDNGWITGFTINTDMETTHSDV